MVDQRRELRIPWASPSDFDVSFGVAILRSSGIGRLVGVSSVSAGAPGNFSAMFVAFISAHKIRFPGNRDFGSERHG
jgi:hypothetical protein